tara:strand:- start:443 stop:562 length:120 start_codon:yes stop_codon:yes gene_type:complete
MIRRSKPKTVKSAKPKRKAKAKTKTSLPKKKSTVKVNDQ